MTKRSLQEVAEYLFSLERDHALFNETCLGVRYWKYIRYRVFLEIAQSLDIIESKDPPSRKSFRDRLRQIYQQIYHAFFASAFSVKRSCEVILFPHTRKTRVNDQWIDIYTAYLENQFESEGFSFLAVEKPFHRNYVRRADATHRYDISFSFGAVLRYRREKKKAAVILKNDGLPARLRAEAENHFGSPLQIPSLTEKRAGKHVAKFSMKERQYRALFQRLNPKDVYLVVGYSGKEPVVSAAHACGIPVTEIQHGVITPYHLGYAFPKADQVPYFPDRLILWGRFWAESTPLPVKNKHIRIDGFPYLESQLHRYESETRNGQQLLVISQPTINRDLMRLVLPFARAHLEWTIQFRLHPSDCAGWRERYPELADAEHAITGLSVIDRDQVSLHQDLKRSSYVLGGYSTALVEAHAAGCHVLLADVPGIEHYQVFLEKGLWRLVRDSEEIETCLQKGELAAPDTDAFIAPSPYANSALPPLSDP